MSEHAIKFLQEWIGEKCQTPALPIKIEQHAETLARECAATAAEAGIPLEDIQEEVGDIQELIASRLEDAVEIDDGAMDETPEGEGERPARSNPAPR
ncbi:hypothetical protein ASD64_11770 [Mesorhizobium sp. Root157]|uniref:DUF768 domain-containing protein n=1 Tax=Mesorhizobium sp. Root157 TaxID=1736477 RepID=UPI0006FE9686|nr:DUF768 domain-containing protein [Mesorhizobium sp. Root157]KQZ79039.1 hypothetical protein ASD64_11770 [Mesorhizobium sp. Root157]